MKRFKNILVVYKHIIGDNDTLSQAIALAKRNKARITLIDVLEPAVRHSGALTAERTKDLERLAKLVRTEGVEPETTQPVGVPFLEIIRQVLRGEHDLVMIAAEGGSVVREFFFGNTAMRLMRKCPCAVWVVNPRGHNNYTRILAAVDPRPDDEEAEKLNIKIMDLAISQASLNDSELHVVHAWEVTGPDLETLRSEEARLGPAGTHAEILHRHRTMHGENLERLLGLYDFVDVRRYVHLPQGSPEISITRIADRQQIDLIVMGTVIRTGIPGFLIGNTAESILRQVSCAVLTVKPDGFVTPVTLE